MKFRANILQGNCYIVVSGKGLVVTASGSV